jgi:hypothetical protein
LLLSRREAMSRKKKGPGNEKHPPVAEGLAPLPADLPDWERKAVLAALKSILPDGGGAPEGGTHAPAP